MHDSLLINTPVVGNDKTDNIIRNISCNGDRSPLNDKIDETVSEFAVKIFDKIKGRAVYKDFSAAINSDKIQFYFQGRIRAEIKPCIMKTLENGCVYVPERHIFLLLREFLEAYGIGVANYRSLSKFLKLFSISVREFFEKNKFLIANIWNRLWHDRTYKGVSKNGPLIGVYLSEGIETRKKSDIHWFPQSQIEPERLLIFINQNAIEKRYRFLACPNKRLLKELQASSFRWVFIPQKMLTGVYKGVWAPKKISLPDWADALAEKALNGLDKWILNICNELLYEINFWISFFEEFNVRILYHSGEGSTAVVAQGIAFDILGEKSGFTVGKQRSDIGHSAKVLTGYHTKDIVFTWNSRNPEYFSLPYNRVHSQVVAGHPNAANSLLDANEIEKSKKQFKKNGVAFIIALFDSGHGSQYNYNFSSAEMEMVYLQFLRWVLEENTLGLIIKSKKPYILETLPNTHSLLKSAEETGRCIRLPFGCFPSTVAQIADMAVGLSVSTATTEAVIAGCKGIHYHSRFPENHEYYKWGYEKLVFDDLDRMVSALKSYKADKSSNPKLGDWTPYLDLLDPFRDGRAGERMGTYLRWCLEGFDAGLNRDDAIKQANNKYAAQWGDDKVVNNHLKEQ